MVTNGREKPIIDKACSSMEDLPLEELTTPFKSSSSNGNTFIMIMIMIKYG